MMRVAPAASLAAQTSQSFVWVIVVDKDLGPSYREELQRIVADVGTVRIHEFDEESFKRHFSSYPWLAPYIESVDSPLLTTWLDDDDALAGVFVERLQRDVTISSASGEQSDVTFYGSNHITQWDFFSSPTAPLGYTKPWVRRLKTGREFVASAGLSLYCSSPRIGLSINEFSHATVKAICDNEVDWYDGDAGLGRNVDEARLQIASALETAGLEASTGALGTEISYKPLDSVLGVEPVAVMTNHLGNMQLHRLFEASDDRTMVRGADSFPGVQLDLGYAAEVISQYRRSWKLLWKAVESGARMSWAKRNRSMVSRAVLTAKATVKACIGVRNLR
jgi:hypothetical protein